VFSPLHPAPVTDLQSEGEDAAWMLAAQPAPLCSSREFAAQTPPMRTCLSAIVMSLALLPAATLAEDPGVGVQVRKPKLMVVPESVVNRSAEQQYLQMKQQAASRGTLNRDAPQVARVRAIAGRLIPQGGRFNAEAGSWAWEVNVVDSPAINAFCMPGGKIMVFRGLIEKLQLNDDELAAVIGHEIAHALLQHGRARMSEAVLKNVGVNLAALYFGLGDLGATALAQAAQVAISLPYSRSHETDADLAGLELAARAGYDPRAAASLWRKMAAAGGSQPPQFLSTHPGHANRIREIEANLPKVMPLYEAAKAK
jgi:predicted Zn-dependent protease